MTIIRWLGQACFLILTLGGAHILIDPPHPEVGYHITARSIPADLVFVSHEHADHNFVEAAEPTGRGPVRVIPPLNPPKSPNDSLYADLTYTFGSPGLPADTIKARRIFAFHDNVRGKKYGPDTITVLETGGLRIVHMGDIGELTLTDNQVKEIGRVDVLMIPVGGYYTVDGAQAAVLVGQLHPRVIIPIHYKTPALNKDLKSKLSGVFPFLTAMRGQANVVTVHARDLKLSPKTLPATPTIYVLRYQ
jgi:L-ascorbate metabolism protein UlaG (beta-lactamase superfamily)